MTRNRDSLVLVRRMGRKGIMSRKGRLFLTRNPFSEVHGKGLRADEDTLPLPSRGRADLGTWGAYIVSILFPIKSDFDRTRRVSVSIGKHISVYKPSRPVRPSQSIAKVPNSARVGRL